jgi:hypothetical protein
MQVVFIVFTGEAWGYLGSRRFLLELDLQSDAVSGLNYSLIETVGMLLFSILLMNTVILKVMR